MVRTRAPETIEVDVKDVKQRLAMFALGVWLAGTILVSVVAAQNFYTIDRLLAESPNATFMSLVERIGRSEARDVLRYLSSELNRLYFRLCLRSSPWAVASTSCREIRRLHHWAGSECFMVST